MFHHPIGVDGVHRRHPNETTPANVISSPIVLNVHRAKIPRFPPEKFQYVDTLNYLKLWLGIELGLGLSRLRVRITRDANNELET